MLVVLSVLCCIDVMSLSLISVFQQVVCDESEEEVELLASLG